MREKLKTKKKPARRCVPPPKKTDIKKATSFVNNINGEREFVFFTLKNNRAQSFEIQKGSFED